MAGRGGYKKT